MAKFAQIDPTTGAILAFLDGEEDNWPDLKKAGVVKRYTGKLEPDAVWDGGKFIDARPPVAARVIPALEFWRRLTKAERREITQAAATGAVSGETDLREAVDDIARSGQIDLDGADAKHWLKLFEDAGLLKRKRIDEMLS